MTPHYAPAIIAVLAAFAFITWPVLAATVLAGLLFMFAFFYATVVYKFNKFLNSKADGKTAESQEFKAWQEPNVRNVTIYLRDRGGNLFK